MHWEQLADEAQKCPRLEAPVTAAIGFPGEVHHDDLVSPRGYDKWDGTYLDNENR